MITDKSSDISALDLDEIEIDEIEIDDLVSEIIEDELTNNDDTNTQQKTKKQNYIDDLQLTELLLIECKNREHFENHKGEGEKGLGSSNKLGAWFIKITDRMLSRGNFRNYSDNYKDEMRSDAYLFFARYWWKFDPKKVSQNWTTPPKDVIWETEYDSNGSTISKTPYIMKGDVKVVWETELKPESEFKGGFSFFTTLAWSGALGALKIRKKEDENRKKIAEDLTKTSRNDSTTEFYVDRSLGEWY